MLRNSWGRGNSSLQLQPIPLIDRSRSRIGVDTTVSLGARNREATPNPLRSTLSPRGYRRSLTGCTVRSRSSLPAATTASTTSAARDSGSTWWWSRTPSWRATCVRARGRNFSRSWGLHLTQYHCGPWRSWAIPTASCSAPSQQCSRWSSDLSLHLILASLHLTCPQRALLKQFYLLALKS